MNGRIGIVLRRHLVLKLFGALGLAPKPMSHVALKAEHVCEEKVNQLRAYNNEIDRANTLARLQYRWRRMKLGDWGSVMLCTGVMLVLGIVLGMNIPHGVSCRDELSLCWMLRWRSPKILMPSTSSRTVPNQ